MKNIGGMPKNLSILLVSNNKLTKFSKEVINSVQQLKYFNVENNLFYNFPPGLSKIATKGPLISFKGTNKNLNIQYFYKLRVMCN